MILCGTKHVFFYSIAVKNHLNTFIFKSEMCLPQKEPIQTSAKILQPLQGDVKYMECLCCNLRHCRGML